MNVLGHFFDMPFGTHLVIGTIIRLALILYGQFHDEMYTVQYTDIDYKVFTDASWHMVNGESPYNRHTYRYSPLLALLLTPNILFNRNFGKILFSLVDIIVGIAIKTLVRENKSSLSQNEKDREAINRIASRSALFWIYNPLSILIATRGNADSLASFFIIMSLLFHQTEIAKGLKKYFISGAMLGIAIHLRIYPLVFSLPMFLSLGDYKIYRKSELLVDLYQLIPNRKQLSLMLGCIMVLSFLTSVFYLCYGYEFLFETYIYHIFRKDIRHNFSLFFYAQYLTIDDKTQYWYKIIPFALLITYFGLRYGRKNTLNFSIFAQSVVLVIYNSVITSQYFVWFLSLLPLSIFDINISKRKASILSALWIVSQAAWLHYAYQLEFEGKNVFFMVWCQGVGFHLVNVYILYELIKNYKPKMIEKSK